YKAFGAYKVQGVEDIDGWKFLLGDEKWVMFRASGTEPVLRVYAQAPNAVEVRAILDAARATVGI
ncbi:MAG: phosphoglucomutase/phosphomannomutase family protein, partial [Saprospiraceae bacterium]